MTFSPNSILETRPYLKQQTGLDDASLGITGDASHYGGYHCGKDRIVSEDYSVIESLRDRNGLSLASSGQDVGSFSKTLSGGRTVSLRDMSLWIVGECQKGAPDTLDIREIIYSPDGVNVKRWDRLKIRSDGDSSHLYHSHFSYFRDSEFRSKLPIFKRYFEGTVPDMTPEEHNKLNDIHYALTEHLFTDEHGASYDIGADHMTRATLWTRTRDILAKLNTFTTPTVTLSTTDRDAIVAGIVAQVKAEILADINALRVVEAAAAQAAADKLKP